MRAVNALLESTAQLRKGLPLMPSWVVVPQANPELIGRRITHPIDRGELIGPDDLDDDFTASVEPLTHADLAALADLDGRLHQQFGVVFADEPWTEDHFAKPLIDKFDFSFVGRIDGRVVGYLVASQPIPGVSQIHRVGVDEPARGTGLVNQLFCDYWKVIIQRPELNRSAGEVNVDNKRARLVYRKSWGFYDASVEEARRYLDIRGRSERLDGNIIVNDDGLRTVPLIRPLEGRSAS